MRETSDLYKELSRELNTTAEYRLVIAGAEYTGGDIVSCSTSGALFESFSAPIGNCIAGQIDLQIRPKGTIPRQAEIDVFARLTDGTRQSEWVPRGVYFFSTRDRDHVTGILTVHGYDAMLKADDTWLDSSYDEENWPMPPEQAAADIAMRMGTTLDPRTVLDPAFPVQYPVDDEGDMTMRKVLERLAVANAGNWTTTGDGLLLLVPLRSIPAETSYLVDEHGGAITFGGVRILI